MRATFFQIVRYKVLHLLWLKGVQVQHAINRRLNGFIIAHAQKISYPIIRRERIFRFANDDSLYSPGREMKIRKASLSDAAIITDFNTRMAWETEKRRLNKSHVARGVRGLLKDKAKGMYFLAEDDGEVAGQLLITFEWSDWRNANFWWIQSVYVPPEFRERGVFRSLYAHVDKLARSRRDVCGLRLYVETDNTRAQKAYVRLGMKESHYKFFEIDFVLK